MTKIQKRISLILSFVLMFNFIMSSFSVCFALPQEATKKIKFTGKAGDYYLSTESGLKKGKNTVLISVETTGVYRIQVKNQGVMAPYDITDSGGSPLPLATYGGKPLSTAASGSVVQVFLQAGKTYKLPVYSEAKDGTNYVISFSLEHAGSTDVTVWDVNSAKYSSAESNEGLGNKEISKEKTPLKDPDEAGERAPSTSAMGEDGANVDFVQKVITWLFVYGIADPLRGIIILLFGDVTIDSLLFNEYNDTKLAFYTENGKGSANGNKLLETPSLEKGMLSLVGEYYAVFRSIAIVFYLIMLLYIGIRIVMKSTARDKDKFKAMLMDWLIGVIMLLFFPMVIKGLILANESLVRILKDRVVNGQDISGGVSSPSANVEPQLLIAMGQKSEEGGSGLMMEFRTKAVKTGNLGYGFVYIYLLIKLFGFLIFFFKRLITILFLILMFPFVAVSYCLDKVKDGTAQIFNNWFKELLLNIFTQFFQAVLWVIVMFVVNALIAGSSNIVVICIGIGFVSKGDMLLRALFPSLLGGGGANTVSPIAKTTQTAVAATMISNVTKNANKVSKRFKDAKESVTNIKNEHNANKTALLEETVHDQEQRLAKQDAANLPAPGEESPLLDEATIRKNDNIPSDTPRDIAEPQRDANLDEKFDAMGQLVVSLSLDETAQATQDAIDTKMQTLNPTQQEKLKQEMKVVRAAQEIMTGKNAAGRKLTRAELSLSANIVFEAMNSTNYENSDVKRWLNNKKVTVSKKVPVSPEIKTKQDAIEWKKKYGKSAYKTEKKEMTMGEYMSFSDAKGGSVGVGLKGKILTKNQQSQMEQGDAFLGGRSGLHTGKTVEGTVDAMTGEKTISTRSKEGKDVGADRVISLSSAEREQSHQRADANGVKYVDKLVQSYAGDADATTADKNEVKAAADLIMELAEYNDRLHTKDTTMKADGVSADEALRITDELTQMAKGNARVQRMVEESISTNKVGEHYQKKEMVVKKQGYKPKEVTRNMIRTAVEDTDKGVKVNIGITVEGLRAMSAKTVLTDKKMDGDTRTGSTQDAINVLQEIAERVSAEDELLDGVEAAAYERSEMDAYIGEDAVIDDAFSLSDGLVREERTNEQILSDDFMQGIQRRAKEGEAAQIKAAEIRRQRPKKMVKAMTTIVDATAGNAVRASTVITSDALYIGMDKTPSMKEFGAATVAGLGIGNLVTHPISKLADTAFVSEALSEREHRKSLDKDPKKKVVSKEEREKNLKAQAAAKTINAFRDKLS